MYLKEFQKKTFNIISDMDTSWISSFEIWNYKNWDLKLASSDEDKNSTSYFKA